MYAITYAFEQATNKQHQYKYYWNIYFRNGQLTERCIAQMAHSNFAFYTNKPNKINSQKAFAAER